LYHLLNPEYYCTLVFYYLRQERSLRFHQEKADKETAAAKQQAEKVAAKEQAEARLNAAKMYSILSIFSICVSAVKLCFI